MSRQGNKIKQAKCLIDSKSCHNISKIICTICPRNPKKEQVIMDEAWMYLDACYMNRKLKQAISK